MGYKNREKEKKFRLTYMNDPGRRISLKKAQSIFNEIYKKMAEVEYNPIIGSSEDLYWNPPFPKKYKANFVRLRKLDRLRGQMTVKGKDKGSNIDRIEIDLAVDTAQAYELITSFLGKEAGVVDKTYIVYRMDEHISGHDDNISIYQVKRDKSVFVEVEARSHAVMNKLIFDLSSILRGYGLALIHESRSLYEMFVKKEK